MTAASGKDLPSVLPEPLPPPWAKPAGHEPASGFTVVAVGGINLWPGPPAAERLPDD